MKISKSVTDHWKELGILDSATKLISDRFGTEINVVMSRRVSKDVRLAETCIRRPLAEVKLGTYPDNSVGFMSVTYL